MKILYIFILFFSVTISFAQVPLSQRKHNIDLYKNNGLEVAISDSADFVRITSEPDSGSELYDIKEYYIKSQKIRFSGKSSRVKPIKLQGQGLGYYENGRRKFLANYKDGEITGTSYNFFPNGKAYIVKENKGRDANSTEPDSTITAVYDSTGKVLAENGKGLYKRYNNDFSKVIEQGPLKNGMADGTWKGVNESTNATYEEVYKDGKLLKGTLTESTGTELSYSQRYMPPKFPGGLDKLHEFLSRHIICPDEARRNNEEGVVLLTFVVEKTGKLNDVKVLISVSPDVDAEAVRVVKNMPEWLPGAAFGKNSRYSYVLPVSFKLQ